MAYKRTRVKICGITHMAAAVAAVEAGADALGFVFASGPRLITLRQAREIIRALPPFVNRVGVFVDAEKEYVLEIAAGCGLDTLQFHGRESPEYCRSFREPYDKNEISGMNGSEGAGSNNGTFINNGNNGNNGSFINDGTFTGY